MSLFAVLPMALTKLQEASGTARCRLSRILPYAIIIVAAEHATSSEYFAVNSLLIHESQPQRRIQKKNEN